MPLVGKYLLGAREAGAPAGKILLPAGYSRFFFVLGEVCANIFNFLTQGSSEEVAHIRILIPNNIERG